MRPTLSPPGVANRRLLLGAVALLLVLAAYLGLAVKPALADHVDTPLASKTPTSLDFDTQQIGTNNSSRTVQVRNEHNGCQLRFLGNCLQPKLVQISGVALGGFDPGGFTITGNTCSGATLNQGASCFVSVRFNPTVAQMHSAVLTIVSNSNFAGGSQVPLTGQGVNPIVSPNPGSLDFGNQVVSTTSASRPVTVTNTGVGTLTIGSASLGGANTGEFVLGSPALPVSLPEGASTTFDVSFAPTITGTRSAELVINSNAAGSPLSGRTPGR